MQERHHEPAPTDMVGCLRQLPALALLDQLPTAMIGVGPLGDIAYANRACADVLGYPSAEAVTMQDIRKLLSGHEASGPVDCVNTLRTTTSVVDWNHDQGYVVRTMLSRPLLLRADGHSTSDRHHGRDRSALGNHPQLRTRNLGERACRTRYVGCSGADQQPAGQEGCPACRLVQVVPQYLRAAGMAQLRHRLRLNLADAFAGDAVDLSDLVERARLAVG